MSLFVAYFQKPSSARAEPESAVGKARRAVLATGALCRHLPRKVAQFIADIA
jgi:hypothetical protein